MATIAYLRKENCMYQACPSQDCNKKVVDQQNGLFRCEKCDKEFPNFKYRMILSVSESIPNKPSQHLTAFHCTVIFFFGLNMVSMSEILTQVNFIFLKRNLDVQIYKMVN